MESDRNMLARLGIVARRQALVLTIRGWGLVVLLVVVAAVITISNVYSFLSPIQRVKSDVLVVEGWIPDYEYPQAIREFRSGHYRMIYTTGGPLKEGFFLSDYGTFARYSAATLMKLGVGADSVVAVPSSFVIKDRTYESAVALRNWIDSTGARVNSFNIFTLAAHGRRTQMLFREALGPNVKIGIISTPDLSYNPRRWWTSSEGVRDIVDESVAYVYAKFLFYPSGH